jgi:hypothetical protein
MKNGFISSHLQYLLKLIVNFQNSEKVLASATHQSRLSEYANSGKIYITFSIFLDDAYVD